MALAKTEKEITEKEIIVIRNTTGVNCISSEKGQEIYDIIYQKLLNNQEVKLDFSGVQIVSAPG